MKTTRAILKNLMAAVERFGEDRMIYGDDDRAMERAGLRVDKAMYDARKHLVATAPKRRDPLSQFPEEKP